MGAGFQRLDVQYFIVKNINTGKEHECDFYDEAKKLKKELEEAYYNIFVIYAVIN